VQKQGAARYVMDIRNNGGGSFPAGVQASRPAAVWTLLQLFQTSDF
jgi:C-terminal processing protease CtpA/Prc